MIDVFVGLVRREFIGHPDRGGQAQTPEEGRHGAAADAPGFGPALIHRLDSLGQSPDHGGVRWRGRGALDLLHRWMRMVTPKRRSISPAISLTLAMTSSRS